MQGCERTCRRPCICRFRKRRRNGSRRLWGGREIGIRVALGAGRGSVVWMVLRGALVLVGLGVALGLPAAWFAARAVGSVLFGVRAEEAGAYLGTVLVLVVFGVVAALVPARR